MNAEDVVSRFNALYLGDSLLQSLEVRTAEAQCRLIFHSGSILEEGEDIFSAKNKFSPAALTIDGVRSISFDPGNYQLNSTVVDFGAERHLDGQRVEFHLELTGGCDPDAFIVRLTLLAMDFKFGPCNESRQNPIP